MPRIYDNLSEDATLLGALRTALDGGVRADACVGYFNLRGWSQIARHVDALPNDGGGVRLLVGMQRLPADDLREHLKLRPDGVLAQPEIGNQAANRIRREAANEFHEQLTLGAPSNQDERTLRTLARQLREERVTVKLFTRHSLHAKLYLVQRPDLITSLVGYLGSSNLTFSGLAGNGELNVDVTDFDATRKLQAWFDDRWDDRFCIDISQDLITAIEESWATEAIIPPYHVYLKMAYHLSQDAREGLREFRIPKVFGDELFDFQVAAVKVAAHHLNQRGGVLIGDVVGLGKTLMATALARIMQEDQGDTTLILCPKNLEAMWKDYAERYQLIAKVVPFSRVIQELPETIRYRLVLIDESHNLRNPEGKQYGAIRDYIERNEARCILLSATPYNKHYLDLAAQLRLFVSPDEDLGIRPEQAIRDAGGDFGFTSKHQVNLRTLAAFEKSLEPDDWRDLMRRYLVRRTRSFIQTHYAETDEQTGRRYLPLVSGERNYFPQRVPKTVPFALGQNETGTRNQYGRLVSGEVVTHIDALALPRYGLAGYLVADADRRATGDERTTIENLGRAGVRLKGFCRTNLFKRLESSGSSFLLSVERHALRNYVFLHALTHGLPVPIGTQDVADVSVDSVGGDQDLEARLPLPMNGEIEDGATVASVETALATVSTATSTDEDQYLARAARLYDEYAGRYQKRFKWLPADLFQSRLRGDLRNDAQRLLSVLAIGGEWTAADDPKLTALAALLSDPARHAQDKVLIFTQFADTADYLARTLHDNVPGLVDVVTGSASDPTAVARRFSPISNGRRAGEPDEIRVLITTDVLSEGQNLQDCHVVVNYDLPWAIIRLIQRVGRVDRIGQKAERILCHSFLPAEGIETIIRLRQRVRQRLSENAEVVGADEVFFEDDGETGNQAFVDLYHEKAGILDDDGDDADVDLASIALQIWKDAIAQDPSLEKRVSEMRDGVFATRAHDAQPADPDGALLFLRTGDGTDALVRVDGDGEVVTHSPLAILRAAACGRDTRGLARRENHHALVTAAATAALTSDGRTGTGLGARTGARFRTYERLKAYERRLNVLTPERIRRDLPKGLGEILEFPLTEQARAALNRQLRLGVSDEELATIVLDHRDDAKLVTTHGGGDGSAKIICSMGLDGRHKA